MTNRPARSTPAARSKPRLASVQSRAELQTRFRVVRGEEIVLGPGKAQLLQHLAQTGSIQEAARQMKMSYMRAWQHIQTMNRSFRQPLVKTVRGGHARGGAELTELGRLVLIHYQALQAAALASAQEQWNLIQSFLK